MFFSQKETKATKGLVPIEMNTFLRSIAWLLLYFLQKETKLRRANGSKTVEGYLQVEKPFVAFVIFL